MNNTAILNRVPQGEYLTRAIVELDEHDQAQQFKEQIHRGLDASNSPTAHRTAHVNFMAELKKELMNRINAR